ncbi:MAG: DUF368 domain-containing protein [Candidatus Doudnabacteria bacterium]|nr:DUF368 domain-containing protein [Candidatus Doudnabacteria bacterium]
MKLRALRLYITGFIMGTADLIPGVSGGTIAFISGIYEELLATIKIVTGTTLKHLLRLRVREAFQSIPFAFGIPLGLGLLTAVFSLAQLIEHLINTHPTMVWAFFFGLVAASTYVVMKRVVRWDTQDYVAFVLTAVFAYILVGGQAMEFPHSTLTTFLSGAIAICAMILPGISGSFILVLLGQYEYILNSVTNHDFATLLVFAAGAVLGISFFARFLSWLFRKHHDISVAALSGFMLGSLRKIWPFPGNTAESFTNVWVWVLIIVGFALVLVLTKYHAIAEQTKDIDDPTFAKEHNASLRSQL